jgi:hypothetical protein
MTNVANRSLSILVDPCRSSRVIGAQQREPIGSPLINPFPEHFLHHVLLARGCHRNEIEAVAPTGRFGALRFADELVVGPSVDVETTAGVDPSTLIALGQVVLVLIGRHADKMGAGLPTAKGF